MEGQFKTIVIGSDHAAIEERKLLIKELESWGIKVIDKGPDAPQPPVQFSLIAESVALEVVNDPTGETGGILMCGNGVGMSVAANKVPGVYATVCHDAYSAERASLSNNCNIITMGYRVIGKESAKVVLKHWLDNTFEEGCRSQSNVDAVTALDEKYRK